jgi:hypothetical protein
MLNVDQTGLWNYCEGYYHLGIGPEAIVTNCGPEDSEYYFDPIEIMFYELLPPYNITFIPTEVDAIKIIQNTSSWLRAAFVLSAMFTGFVLVIGSLTGVWHEIRLLNCIPVLIMCIASIFWFSGAVTATNVYFRLRNSFNDDLGLNVEAHMGRKMFIWVWLGVVVSWIATSQWFCTAICCPGGYRKRRIEMKKRILITYWLSLIL